MAASVLIVEDNTLLREVMALALAGAGYEAVISDGRDALATARSSQPGLILLDLVLPGVNGVEVCRQLRANVHTREIPIIVITGGTVPDGMDIVDVLSKPFPIQALLTRVNRRIVDDASSERVQNDSEGRVSTLVR